MDFSATNFQRTDMYNKYRAYFDYEIEAKPVALFSPCLLLSPKLMMTQSDFASESLPIWLPVYRVAKILTNSNYIVRQLGTNYTQCVQRIRLRPVTPRSRVEDLTVINFENCLCDPLLGHFRCQPTVFDESIPSLLGPPTTVVATRNMIENPPPVAVSFWFPVAPAPVPVGLAPGPAPVHLPALAAPPAPVVLPEPVENEVAEPPSPEWLPTIQYVRFFRQFWWFFA